MTHRGEMQGKAALVTGAALGYRDSACIAIDGGRIVSEQKPHAGTKVRILAVNGSPHRAGNTVTLIEEVFRGARTRGHTGELVHLVDLHLDYCNWCGECADSGVCRVDDGLREHVERIRQADVLVVGTPSSTHSVTGYMKNWLDRFCNSQLIFKVDEQKRVSMRSRVPAGKRAIIIVQGCTDLLQETVEPINVVMAALEIPVLARLVVPKAGLTEDDTVDRRPDVMQRAFAIGQEVDSKESPT